jgi:hypothetical protein
MGWEELIAIEREAVEVARQERAAPPTACPDDGTPLETGANGVLGCKFCGWRDR